VLACDVVTTCNISDGYSVHANLFKDCLLLIIPPELKILSNHQEGGTNEAVTNDCLMGVFSDKARKMLHDIWQAETRVDAHASLDLFIETFDMKYPKATKCLMKDRDEFLSFYDFPAQHWQRIRTSNSIKSAFATIRHRTKRTKGCLNRYDVQARPKCKEKLIQAARLCPSRRCHTRRRFRKRHQVIKP